MKKRILLLTVATGIGVLTLCSYQTGPAANGYNRTGAQNTTTTCGGNGCHGGTSSATSVSITVDSSSTAVTKYVGGATYTIHINGSNTSSLPKFGFEYTSVSGSGASQVQAGTYTSLPTGVGNDVFGSLHFVEHHTPLAGTSGSYSVSFQWVAPVAGTGTVTMYCTLNAVNGNGDADAADLSNNTSVTLTEETSHLGVANVSNSIDAIVYPNPVSNALQVKLNEAGNYAIKVYDLNGRQVASENAAGGSATSINASNWAAGMYEVQVVKDGAMKVISVIKK